MSKSSASSLPYRDTKPVGAADFYFGINATFRFIRDRLGEEGLVRYWRDMGADYFRPVTESWKSGGLPAVARYWRDFFAAEPGADVGVDARDGEVRLDARTCPAIARLRAGGREIDPGFCRHCYFVSETMAAPAGLSVRVEGGNGSCRQRFFVTETDTPPQDPRRIASCS